MSSSLMKHNIILTGFMGTGKTSVGKRLADLLHWQYVDVDETIEKQVAMSISEYFKTRGEPSFRDIESSTLYELLSHQQHVISTGGGAVIRQENRRLMHENGFVICLEATPEVIFERIHREKHRPVLGNTPDLNKIQQVLQERIEYYKDSDWCIDTSQKTVFQVVEEIINHIKRI